MAELAHGYDLRYVDGVARIACSCGTFAVVRVGRNRRKLVLEHLRRLHEIHAKAAELVDAFPQFPSHTSHIAEGSQT